MTLWDRIKKNAEQGIESIKRGAGFVTERARIEVSLTRIHLQSGKIEKNINGLYQKIGERLYTLTTKKERNILKDREITETLEEITRLIEDLSKLQREARLISSGEVEGTRSEPRE
jgi:flagellin-specific chaperone FliS